MEFQWDSQIGLFIFVLLTENSSVQKRSWTDLRIPQGARCVNVLQTELDWDLQCRTCNVESARMDSSSPCDKSVHGTGVLFT